MYLGIIEKNCTCINHTLAGDLNIEVKDGFIMMDMASPEEISIMDDPEKIKELYDIMGASYNPSMNLPVPRMISTGLPDIMMPVTDLAALNAIEPDMKALSALSERYGVVGVHAFTVSCEEGVTAHARNFAPLYDIDEEAATGTSSGAMTYYFYLNKLIEEKSSCKFIQGEKMDRPSVILTEIEASCETCRVNRQRAFILVQKWRKDIFHADAFFRNGSHDKNKIKMKGKILPLQNTYPCRSSFSQKEDIGYRQCPYPISPSTI